MIEPKYPHVEVLLGTRDDNIYSIMKTARERAKRAGLDADEIERFCREAIDGDYDHAIEVCMRWFCVT